jgi:alkylated DNA repair protein alkB family protein 7
MGRDSIRYGFKHSILPYNDQGSVWDGERLKEGHRLSLMVRVSIKRISG